MLVAPSVDCSPPAACCALLTAASASRLAGVAGSVRSCAAALSSWAASVCAVPVAPLTAALPSATFAAIVLTTGTPDWTGLTACPRPPLICLEPLRAESAPSRSLRAASSACVRPPEICAGAAAGLVQAGAELARAGLGRARAAVELAGAARGALEAGAQLRRARAGLAQAALEAPEVLLAALQELGRVLQGRGQRAEVLARGGERARSDDRVDARVLGDARLELVDLAEQGLVRDRPGLGDEDDVVRRRPPRAHDAGDALVGHARRVVLREVLRRRRPGLDRQQRDRQEREQDGRARADRDGVADDPVAARREPVPGRARAGRARRS